MTYIFDKIEERDIDFVVMRAFAEISDFPQVFLDKIGMFSDSIVNIEHSYMDKDGESDITVILSCEGKNFALLIEDKIDAAAMDEQCRRYSKRGETGKADGKYDDFAVFLIAPQAYIETNNEAKKYSNIVTYEELLTFFKRKNRSFDVQMMESAIQKQAKGYVVQEVPAITDFWRKLNQYCSVQSQIAKMYFSDTPRGGRSTWPQFKIPLKGASLYYKSKQGVVDLEFNGKTYDRKSLRTILSPFVGGRMHWKDTGASASLRIEVRPMNFRKPFETYVKEPKEMLEAVEELTLLAIKLNDIGLGL